MKVAVIGVGNMGKPMAANLVKGGHDVSVFDADRSRASGVATEIGAVPLAFLKDCATAEIIITMLPDGHAVRAVALGDDGFGSAAKA